MLAPDPIQTARWLSLEQAAKYCPYGKKKLIRLIKERKLKGGQMADNKDGWFVDRLSLDGYMQSQCVTGGDIEKKVIEYLERVQ